MSDTLDWMQQSRKKAKETKGKLPNPTAPKLVFEDKKIPKSQLPIRIATPAYQQLSRLVKLKQIAGHNVSMQGLFIEGLDLLLKENGLHNLEELTNGAVFEEKDADKLKI